MLTGRNANSSKKRGGARSLNMSVKSGKRTISKNKELQRSSKS